MPDHTNRLIHETSPYLLQHAHNPVDWYPWGAEALAEAQTEHKPILLSIGYSSCHWCHVMEKESFEDEETAARRPSSAKTTTACCRSRRQKASLPSSARCAYEARRRSPPGDGVAPR
jgi:hypothetical protein